MIPGRIDTNKRYVVRLTREERERLQDLVAKGKAAAYRIRHANILPAAVDADRPNWPDARAAEAFRCRANTGAKARRRLVEGVLEAALARKKQARPSRRPVPDGEAETGM